jgi:hypothetical protein
MAQAVDSYSVLFVHILKIVDLLRSGYPAMLAIGNEQFARLFSFPVKLQANT